MLAGGSKATHESPCRRRSTAEDEKDISSNGILMFHSSFNPPPPDQDIAWSSGFSAITIISLDNLWTI